MRGTLSHTHSWPRYAGIIPAYAGNTSVNYPQRRNARDHPRVCGEHHWRKYFYSPYTGSSPRMRGTPASRSLSPRPNGIIPAYAGNTPSPRFSRFRPRDHPRVCGEHGFIGYLISLVSGSSPRMRGTLNKTLDDLEKQGIIPAYAGNTTARAISAQEGRDHPRVCGEHIPALRRLASKAGSSPRMRGTLRCCRRRCRGRGIIPAYAGNTRMPLLGPLRCRDHPRVCGEHCCGMAWFIATTGSSPRMRGTRVLEHAAEHVAGIIPAYAGNTRADSPRPTVRRDHPRVCGEHMGRKPQAVSRMGSSPRMRGTPDSRFSDSIPHGIIPAYAGNTYYCRWFSGF